MKPIINTQKTFSMKRLFLLLIAAAVAVSCGNTHRLNKSYGKEVAVDRGLIVHDTKTMFREVGTGSSMRQDVAEEKARANALERLAQRVQARVKQTVEDYVKEYDLGNSRDMGSVYERLSIVTADATMTLVAPSTSPKPTLTRNSKTGEYTYQLVMEVNKDNVVSNLTSEFEKVVKDKKTDIDYSRDKFREYVENNL